MAYDPRTLLFLVKDPVQGPRTYVFAFDKQCVTPLKNRKFTEQISTVYKFWNSSDRVMA